MNIRILHTADLHLDSPFSRVTLDMGEASKKELRKTFSDMISYARTQQADLILISGDLFDSGFATRETAALITRELENAPCPVVIAPGNHDPYDSNSIWSKKSFSDNVHIFDSSELSYFDFPESGVRVYGYAFTAPSMRQCPISGKTVENGNTVNILCAHGDTASALSQYCPITYADLSSFGADYAALGHIHNPEAENEALEAKGISAAYCGCPQGRDFGECGIKGAILVDIEKNGGDVSIKRTFVPFSKKIYEEVSVQLEGSENTAEVISEIRTCMADKNYGENTILRIDLCGYTAPGLVIVCEDIAEACRGDLASLTVTDSTAPQISAEELSIDKGIRGEVYRLLSPAMENGSPEERNQALDALKYALAALGGENI